MKIVQITYDLNKPGQNHQKTLEIIKKFKNFKLSESSYLIKSNLSCNELWESYFKTIIDQNDDFFILETGVPLKGYANKPKLARWLQEKDSVDWHDIVKKF